MSVKMLELPAELRKALDVGNVVPFVGPGIVAQISGPVVGEPLVPSARRLLEIGARELDDEQRQDLSKLVRELIAHEKSEYWRDAADQIAKGLLGTKWEDFIEENLGPRRLSPMSPSLAAARLVWRLAKDAVLTTNHDDVLRWACLEARYGFIDALGSRIGRNRPIIWHLCGHVHYMSKLRFTPSQYGPKPPGLSALRNQILGKTLVFLGFSSADPFLFEHIQWMRDHELWSPGPHFLLASTSDDPKALSRLVDAYKFGDSLVVKDISDFTEFIHCVETSDLPRHIEIDALQDRPIKVDDGCLLGFGRYQIVKRIGEGGFGVVWQAIDRYDNNREIALKVLKADLADRPKQVRRFFRGALAMRKLDAPSIVRVIEPRHEDAGNFYYTMELFKDSITLAEAVRRERAEGKIGMSFDRLLPIVWRVCDALTYAHDHGMIHRDVKPGNILIDADDNAKLTDFDLVLIESEIASVATQGDVGGTFHAPERRNGKSGDVRTDVWNLGMTIIEVLDHNVFDKRYYGGGDVDKLPCSTTVKSALRQATNSDPDKRFQSIDDFCTALKRASQQRQIPLTVKAACMIGLAAGFYAIGREWRVPIPIPPPDAGVVDSSAPSASVDAMAPMPPVPVSNTPGDHDEVPIPNPMISGGKRPDEGPRPSSSESSRPIASTDAGVDAPSAPECLDTTMVGVPAASVVVGGFGVKRQQLKIDAFCIDKSEVTVANYQLCIDRKQCSPKERSDNGWCTFGASQRANHPINCITWKEASNYCTKVEKRLPTAAEWEYAARGTNDSQPFPWGTNDPYSNNNYANACDKACLNSGTGERAMEGATALPDNHPGTATIGAFPAGKSLPFGLFDMAGNVAEWTTTEACEVWETNGGSCQYVIIKGGSFRTNERGSLFVTAAPKWPKAKGADTIGFRCAASPKAGKR